MARDFDITWEQLEGLDFFLLLVMVIISVLPFVSAARNQTSFALAMVLSLLLAHFFRFALRTLDFDVLQFYIIDLMSIIPSISDDPAQIHRMFTSAWLHADFIHVLGNILVIALAGVPLEQRLGAKRWIVVYFLGFLGGNLAWILSHPDSNTPAIGASGAAFGILGAYMACWPEDKIEFPLLFFIRAWPVWLIAFVRLGIEILQMYSIQSGTSGETNIAHMAHVGGFFLCYALARTIAKGGPSPIGGPGESVSGSSLSENLRRQAINKMGDTSVDPWSSAGKPLEGRAARILSKLRKEGDELETRRAWLEELSENAICPVCEGELITIDEAGVCKIVCPSNHTKWP